MEIKEQSQTKPGIKDRNTQQKHIYKSHPFLPPPQLWHLRVLHVLLRQQFQLKIGI